VGSVGSRSMTHPRPPGLGDRVSLPNTDIPHPERGVTEGYADDAGLGGAYGRIQ
jgi:hypothetical protein